MTTSAINTQPTAAAAAPKPDAQCVTLATQIDTLRKEGTSARLEAAAVGKSATVPVLRAALKKQSELNKANAEFQAKCSKVPTAPQQSAQAPATPAAATVAAAAPGVATKAAAAASGVTSAKPTSAAKALTPAPATNQ
jgi:hypothetical protein